MKEITEGLRPIKEDVENVPGAIGFPFFNQLKRKGLVKGKSLKKKYPF